MQIIRQLSYIGKRLMIIIPALFVVAGIMLAMKRLEYSDTIEPGVSKLASVLYFHVASFGVLWLLLRAPFCWQRVVLVAVWIAYDVVIWTITGCYTGERFDWSYAATIWQETLLHRYAFFACAYVVLAVLNTLTKSRIVLRSESIPVSQISNGFDLRQFSLPRILRWITFIAVGLALVVQLQKLLQTKTPWQEIRFWDVLDFSVVQFKSALWSCLRGIIMWYIALWSLGKGKLHLPKAVTIACLLPAINLGLMSLQQRLGMADDVWEVATPNFYAKTIFDQFQWIHALIASMLTFISVITIRVWGYEFRSNPFKPEPKLSSTSFDKIDV